jgi:lysophospholipase L1-like esterase
VFELGSGRSLIADLSLTQYQGNYDVLNRGMGGYNSTQLLQRFQEGLDIPAGADVRLVVIHIGTNDWSAPILVILRMTCVDTWSVSRKDTNM